MLELYDQYKYEIGLTGNYVTRISPDMAKALISRIERIEGVHHCECNGFMVVVESVEPIKTKLRAIIKDINNNQY